MVVVVVGVGGREGGGAVLGAQGGWVVGCLYGLVLVARCLVIVSTRLPDDPTSWALSIGPLVYTGAHHDAVQPSRVADPASKRYNHLYDGGRWGSRRPSRRPAACFCYWYCRCRPRAAGGGGVCYRRGFKSVGGVDKYGMIRGESAKAYPCYRALCCAVLCCAVLCFGCAVLLIKPAGLSASE